MGNRIILVILGVLIIIVAGYILTTTFPLSIRQESVLIQTSPPNGTAQPAPPPTGESPPSAPAASQETNQPEPMMHHVTMDSGNYFFSPKTITVKKGETVQIVFRNQGSHTFTINALNINKVLQSATEILEFTPNKTGTFEFHCAVGNHRSMGMFGTLIVE